MTSRKSERISKRQSHPGDNIDVISSGSKAGNENGVEQVPAPIRPKLPARKGRGGGGGGRVARARGSGRRGQPNQPNGRNDTTSTSNITVKTNTLRNEVDEIRKAGSSTENNVNDLRAALEATNEEVIGYMRSVTGVLCALFSVLTITQIKDIENSTNDMKDDDLLSKCLNQAKSSAAARDLSLKMASMRNVSNEQKRNSPINEATRTPQSIVHHSTNRGPGTTPSTNANAQAPRNARDGGSRNNAGRPNNNEISNTNQATNTARDDWLRKLDEDRKYNVILFGIHDTNNKQEDHRIVDEVLWTIGCQHRIANKINIKRLGAKNHGRSKLLLVCFDSEAAASQVLNRSPNLVKSASYGHIYIKKDLPRDQRPPPRNKGSRIAQAARGASIVTPAVQPARPPAAARHNPTDRYRQASSPPTAAPAPAPTNTVDNGGVPPVIARAKYYNGVDSESPGWYTREEVLGDGEPGDMVTVTTAAQVHRPSSPMAEEVGSIAAPTHVTTNPIEDTIINLEEISEPVNTEPGDDEGGANNTHTRRNINVEQRPGNEQVQEEVIPG